MKNNNKTKKKRPITKNHPVKPTVNFNNIQEPVSCIYSLGFLLTMVGEDELHRITSAEITTNLNEVGRLIQKLSEATLWGLDEISKHLIENGFVWRDDEK